MGAFYKNSGQNYKSFPPPLTTSYNGPGRRCVHFFLKSLLDKELMPNRGGGAGTLAS